MNKLCLFFEMLFFYPSLSPPQLLICLFLIISYFVIICTIIITKNNADHISTICVIPLMSSWNIYSIFFQSLLQIYSILKICYDILRYSMIPFLWRKMSVNLDFQRTFQYFQALYSVVRISSQLFHYNIYEQSRNLSKRFFDGISNFQRKGAARTYRSVCGGDCSFLRLS